MSRDDAPLWVRAVAAVLLLVASWWLLRTEALRSLLGDSVAAFGVGVVAFSVLRGLHLPLRIWPEGPWRRQFRSRAVVGAAVGMGAIILLARTSMTEGLSGRIDVGTFILFATGVVFWGFGVAMVRQRSYLQWYGLAMLLGVAPVALSLLAGNIQVGTPEWGDGICWWSVGRPDAPDSVVEDRCGAGFLPAMLLLLGTGMATRLVTEELAFRRLLIGCARRTALVWVLAAAVAATFWYWTLAYLGFRDTAAVIAGGLGAASAGCLYVLSCSLPVSALFSAALAASSSALELSTPFDATVAAEGPPMMFWAILSLTALILCVAVWKQNGVLGVVRAEDQCDAAGD